MTTQTFVDAIAADLQRVEYHEQIARRHERSARAAAEQIEAGLFLVSGGNFVLEIDPEDGTPTLLKVTHVELGAEYDPKTYIVEGENHE